MLFRSQYGDEATDWLTENVEMENITNLLDYPNIYSFIKKFNVDKNDVIKYYEEYAERKLADSPTGTIDFVNSMILTKGSKCFLSVSNFFNLNLITRDYCHMGT